MLWQLFLLDAVVMTLCWLWATVNHRAGIVDVAWSFVLFSILPYSIVC
jgi:steroid 5-alpha reductase family enzyme